MIQADQPTCFNSSVIAAVSSRSDGQMQLGWSESDQEVIHNRQQFLRQCGLGAEQSALVRIRYSDDATYDVIRSVNASRGGSGMHDNKAPVADCLITHQKGVALFLPIADCIGTVVHDPTNNVLALAHLGRHNSIAHLAKKLVAYLSNQYGSQAKDLIVWGSPAIQAPSYLLHRVDFAKDDPSWERYYQAVQDGFRLDIQGYNKNEYIKAGVTESNIYISEVDTATNQNYWSHYTQTTTKKRTAPPRFAVVCAMK